MRTTRVALKERSYPILVGPGLLSQAGAQIRKLGLASRHWVVVTQKEIAAHHQQALADALGRSAVSHSFYIVPSQPSSEAAKSADVYWKLIREFAAHSGQNRSVAALALGGGVVGDLTGFAASVYRRGVPYIQVPTTLTAQVDSAVGGKTGIDLPEGKNLLGTIYQPAAVLADTDALRTLPDRHWSDGFAEVIKYGMIQDARLFEMLESKGADAARRPPLLDKIVFRCAEIKARVVEKDELDRKDIRIFLNFGHTAGHGIEAAARFSHRYTHGEAVGIGMLVACGIASELGVLKEAELPQRLERVLVKFRLPLSYKGLNEEAIFKAIGHDKKSDRGTNRFILPVRLAKTRVVRDVPVDVILRALRKRKG